MGKGCSTWLVCLFVWQLAMHFKITKLSINYQKWGKKQFTFDRSLLYERKDGSHFIKYVEDFDIVTDKIISFQNV